MVPKAPEFRQIKNLIRHHFPSASNEFFSTRSQAKRARSDGNCVKMATLIAKVVPWIAYKTS